MTEKPSGLPAVVVVKVIRRTGRKAVRKARRFGRKARRWIRGQWRRQLLARENPRPVAILDHVRACAGRPADIQPRIAQEIEAHGLTLALAAVHTALELARKFDLSDREQQGLYTAAMRAAAEVDPARAAAVGDQYFSSLFDPRAGVTLVKLHRSLRNYERALEVIEALPRDEWYAVNAPLLHSRGRQQRLERLFGDDLRAAALVGEREVLRVAERVFAEAGDAHLLAAFRALRSVLGRGFRSNRELSRLLISYAEHLPPLDDKDVDIASAVSEAHLHAGDLSAGWEALNRLVGHTPRGAARLARLTSLRRLLDEGFHYQPELPDEGPRFPVPGRVLCMLHNSLPYNSGGYATRTHGLLSGLHRRGWNVSGVTRLGYPQLPERVEKVSQVGEVSYLRLFGGDVSDHAVRHDYLKAYVDALLQLAGTERPEIVHACSNHMNGVAANALARALRIKSVYEVRGLWEITRISRQPEWEGTEYYNLMSRMEVQVACEADAVICITQALKDEMVRRGVPAEKITIVPNGVDVDRFVPRPRSEALAERLGLQGKRVIGYIGSVVDYEGLDLLLRAVELLRARGASGFAALVVGDGAALEGLQRLSAELRLDDLVTFTGRVPHEQVEEYYSLVDVVPLPRKSLPVTEMVSPLKPFEAMAMDKIVVASDVAALAEIVEDGVNGLLFRKDDVADLADKLAMVLDPAFAHSMRPRDWVVANRSWQHLSSRVEELYRRLTSRLLPLAEVALAETPPSPDFEAVRSAYREKLDGDERFLRLDDYARWSYVASRVASESSLLDVGVGVGQFLNALAARGTFRRLVGVDLQPHGKFLRLHDGFAMDYVSIDSLPYEDGEFDVVTCMETLEHLPEKVFVEGLRQLRRVCRDQLLVTVPFREEKLGTGHVRRFDLSDLERLFPRAAITILHRRSRKNGRTAYWALIEERRRPEQAARRLA